MSPVCFDSSIMTPVIVIFRNVEILFFQNDVHNNMIFFKQEKEDVRILLPQHLHIKWILVTTAHHQTPS